MPRDGRYLKNAGAIFNGMPRDGRYLKNAEEIFNGVPRDGRSDFYSRQILSTDGGAGAAILQITLHCRKALRFSSLR
jgi:hypothetical protein